MPSLGEPGTPAPFHEDRAESLGEAEYRIGGWLLVVLRLFSGKYRGKRYEDAAAVLAGPLLERFPALRKWKAPKGL